MKNIGNFRISELFSASFQFQLSDIRWDCLWKGSLNFSVLYLAVGNTVADFGLVADPAVPSSAVAAGFFAAADLAVDSCPVGIVSGFFYLVIRLHSCYFHSFLSLFL